MEEYWTEIPENKLEVGTFVTYRGRGGLVVQIAERSNPDLVDVAYIWFPAGVPDGLDGHGTEMVILPVWQTAEYSGMEMEVVRPFSPRQGRRQRPGSYEYRNALVKK